MNRQINKQAGFTILELLIATAIFSVILLVATSGIIYLGKIFYKGVTLSKTQEKARTISEELSKSLQFSGSRPEFNNGSVKILCMGDTRYYYTIGTKVDDPAATLNSPGQIGLVAIRLGTYEYNPDGTLKGINASSCSLCPITLQSCQLEKRQLLSKNMRLTEFSLGQVGDPNNNLWNIKVGIAYGDGDLFVDNSGTAMSDIIFKDPAKATEARCTSNQSGGSFCAVSKLDTTLKRRIK
ncbi:prepilin-type N-terminal cleavage/methylation domain-containing protein [Candidatus Saccharibacteria bacterium]|nr:prepilin-type N-terminal cleavage/methylation domain-containing protein [Candidatus Saccharibacteria bacterium]